MFRPTAVSPKWHEFTGDFEGGSSGAVERQPFQEWLSSKAYLREAY